MEINLDEGREKDIAIQTSRDRSRLFVYEEGGRKTLFLACEWQVFKNEIEALGAILQQNAGSITLYKEQEIEAGSAAAKEKSAVKILSDRKETQGIKEILGGVDADMETAESYYAFRQKKEQLIVYTILPYEEDPEEV